MKYRDVHRILVANGWKRTYCLHSQNRYVKETDGITLYVADLKEKHLPNGLLADLEKKTGLSFR